jgi:HAD superfamily hydrolase (TIGR01490 family)
MVCTTAQTAVSVTLPRVWYYVGMTTGEKFAVFDIDGTLIRWQLFHAIVHSMGKQGFIPPDAHKRIQEARMAWKVRTSDEGFGAYELALVKEYLAALKKVDVQQYPLIVQEVFEEYKDQAYTYTRDLIARLKGEGYVLFAISGSHHEIVQKLAGHYGFDDVVGAAIEQVDGSFSGKINTPIFDKAAVLRKLIDKHRVGTAGSVGVGDSHSDISMLELVERPIIFNPDKKTFEAARERQWQVVVERKNMIYELLPSDNSYILKAPH